MQIGNTDYKVKSSFLSVEKDLALIVTKMLEDKELQKLLYYSDNDCLSRPELTQEQTYTLIGNQIKVVPKLEIDSQCRCYIIISFDNFTPSSNPEFRDNIITFDIICHHEQWSLGDFKLRPYKIAGRIDGRLNNKKLTGIGTLQFISAGQLVLNDELSGLSLVYQAVHGGEDTNDK